MRWIALSGVALAASLVSSVATAQAPTGCRAWNEDPESAVSGCTELLTFLENTGSAHWVYKERGYGFAYFGRAMAYRALNKDDLAIADFTRSIQNDPTAVAYATRGVTYARQGDYAAARRDLEEAAHLDPANEAIKQALARVDAARQPRPAPSPADRAAGDQGRKLNACIRGGDFDDILAACDLVLFGGDSFTASQRAEAYAARGRVQLYRKHYADAADDLSQAVELAPDEPNYRTLLDQAQAGSREAAAVVPVAATATVPQWDLVRRAQAGLAKLGYAPGAADGKAGPRTVAAVRAYQRSSGLPADGVVTAELVERIEAQPR